MKLELLCQNKENEYEMDFINRILKLLKGNTENNTLKRKSEERLDCSQVTKYRKVNNEFAMIIENSFDDDIQTSKLSPKNTNTFNKQNNTSPVILTRKNISFADLEFSDDEEDTFKLNKPNLAKTKKDLQNRPQHVIDISKINFNKTKTNKNESLQTNFQFFNIPVKFESKYGSNKQGIPPLIEANTGSIFTNNQEKPSHLDQIKKCGSPNFSNSIGEKFDYNINNQKMTNGNQIKINSYNTYNINTNSSKSSSNYLGNLSRFQHTDVLRTHNIENINKGSNSSERTNTLVNKVYNFQDKESYEELLKTYAPTLYDSSYNSPNFYTNKISYIKSPTGRPSIHNPKSNFVENVDLTEKGISKRLPGKPENLEYETVNNLLEFGSKSLASVEDTRNFTDFEKNRNIIPAKKYLPNVKAINTLKEKNELIPVNNPSWLTQFKENFEKKQKQRDKQIKDATEEAKRYSKETELAQRLINEKLKNFRISAETIFIDEEEEVEDIEFPVLTNEDGVLIKKALYGRNLDEVLIEKFNISIKRRDIQTLMGDSWLNDEVINFYMNLLMERGDIRSSEGYPKVYAMNTFFIPRLSSSGHSGVRRWTRKVDIFCYDIIPVPVHVGGVHWCMAIIHLKNKTIKYYDSMGTPNPKVLQTLEQYLKDEHLDKKGLILDTSNITKESVTACPRQMNGSDCGVFSCMFAEYITRNKNITFSQQHMQYFRQKMILEIVKGKLLL